MNARNVAGTSPSGRIILAKARMAIMTSAGPRILYFSIGGPSAKTPPIATAAPRAASTNENSLGAVPACFGMWKGIQQETQGTLALSVGAVLVALVVGGLLIVLRVVHWIA